MAAILVQRPGCTGGQDLVGAAERVHKPNNRALHVDCYHNHGLLNIWLAETTACVYYREISWQEVMSNNAVFSPWWVAPAQCPHVPQAVQLKSCYFEM